MAAEHPLSKDPQLRRSITNIRSGAGTLSTSATSTSHKSSIETAANNGPTVTAVHEDSVDLRNEINHLLVQKQERPETPEATSVTDAINSHTTRIAYSAGEYLLNTHAVSATSAPTFLQSIRSTLPAATHLSPNDFRAESQFISEQIPGSQLRYPAFDLSSILADRLPVNDLRSEIQSIARQMREKSSIITPSSKDPAKDTTTGENNDHSHTRDRGWDRYRPKYGSRTKSRSRSRSRSGSRKRKRSWSRLRIRSSSRSPDRHYRSSRRRSRSRSRGRSRERTRDHSRGRSRKMGSRSRSRDRTKSGSRTRPYKGPRSTSRGRSSSPKARRTGPYSSTSKVQSASQTTASKQISAAPTEEPPILFLKSSEATAPSAQPKISTLGAPLLLPKSDSEAIPPPKMVPPPVQVNIPAQAKSTEQLPTAHDVPGIPPHNSVPMSGNDERLSYLSLTSPRPATLLRTSPSMQDLAMNGNSDTEIVRLEPKHDSIKSLSDDLKPTRQTRHSEVYSGVYSSECDATCNLSQGGTRYFLMRCSSANEILEAQDTNIWPTNILYHDRLQSAFANSTSIRLIFTVRMSREFCGIADMTSAIGWHQQAKSIFDVSKHRQCMRISWISKSVVSYDRILENLQLPAYSVIFRNGQELPRNVGETIFTELSQQSTKDPNLQKREIE